MTVHALTLLEVLHVTVPELDMKVIFLSKTFVYRHFY